MNTYLIIWPLLWLMLLTEASAQTVKYQTDKHIVNQQERMVFKQWDRDKFTPKKGFLSLNYQYWITWALHPRYPRTDRRPLSLSGPQTLRLLLVAAMKSTEEAYKKHADTLRHTAVTELANHAGAVSGADPLWLLYYSHEFRPLTEEQGGDALDGSSAEVRDYLTRTGVLEWYLEESKALAGRLEGARTADIDRGSRIMAYHRMLGEYRQLQSLWEAKKQRAAFYLRLARADRDIHGFPQSINVEAGRSDIQIADGILRESKL